MCEFISWIETKDKVYFLTKTQLESPRGEMLKLRFPGSGEFTGHNAIRAFYDIDTGTERECTDFATPKNFPVVIAQAIKNNQMCYSNPDFSQLLLEKALKNGKQDPDVDKAWEDRNKAWEAYNWTLFRDSTNRRACWR